MKYFVFNKALDYDRGYTKNCCWEDGALTLKEGCKQGIVFSRLLDSREQGNIWHRLIGEPDIPMGASMDFLFYAGNERKLRVGEEERDIEEILTSAVISPEEKKRIFHPFLQMETKKPKDMLLFDIQGRYLWFAAELYGGEARPRLRNLTICFPKETWLRFLPGVYQKDKESRDFLERYLGIFQSVYEELEDAIRRDASWMDPEAAEPEFLRWLAQWLDMGNIPMWTPKKLKKLVKNAMRLFDLRGTRRGLLELVELYTGEKPLIVEEWQTREMKALPEKKAELKRLYGREPGRFTLLVKEEYLSSARDYQAMEQLVREAAPAWMEAKLVPLRPCIQLGDYTYLGINSRLGQYRPLKLDGLSAIPFTVIGGSGQEGGDGI
jgi:phage tail-like protein